MDFKVTQKHTINEKNLDSLSVWQQSREKEGTEKTKAGNKESQIRVYTIKTKLNFSFTEFVTCEMHGQISRT